MSDETTAAIPVAEPQGKTNSHPSLDKGSYTLEFEEFSRGITKGFGFFYKQYKNIPDAIAHLDSLNKDSKTNGEGIVLALLNQAIKNANRGKANSRLPAQEENDTDGKNRLAAIEARRVKNDVVLIGEADAENYVPGTREKTSIPALWKEYQSLLADFKKAKELGHNEEMEELRAEAKELKARIDELTAADDDLLNL